MPAPSRIPRGRRPRTARGPVVALVAAGSSPPGREVLDGELLWIPLPCGRADCSCTVDFTGAVTHGLTDRAGVRTFPDATRTELRRAIAAAMCPDCVPPHLRSAQAEHLLRTAERLGDGALARRDASGRIVPLSSGSAGPATRSGGPAGTGR